MANILLVEDDHSLMNSLSRFLKKKGHTVVSSNNGRHAYETICQNDLFDLIITDIMMPEMTGKDLIPLVRGLKDYAKTPIIAMSGVVSVKDISEYLELGATAFIKKPVKLAELLEYIEKFTAEGA